LNIIWAGSANPDLNRALGTWCAQQIGMPRPFEEPYTTMGVMDGTELTAVILYNNYQPEAGVIEFHGASTTARWLTKPVLDAMFDYPFEQIGCQMVVTRNSAKNNRLKRVLSAYGFEHVTIPRLRGRDEDERIFWLSDDAWRSNKFNR